jgi:hypothetical protein
MRVTITERIVAGVLIGTRRLSSMDVSFILMLSSSERKVPHKKWDTSLVLDNNKMFVYAISLGITTVGTPVNKCQNVSIT